MTIFWILAAGLAVLALVFALPPLLRRAEGAPDLDRNALNLDVFRQQLAELDGDLALGKLDQDQYEAARRDLERELVHDLEPVGPDKAQHPAQTKAGNKPWAALILALAIPAAAVALYLVVASRWSYSSGERAGYVQKFSKKGWVCKTWEGEIAMANLPGAMPELFPFTVRDEAVAAQINAQLGARVVLSYEQHLGLPSCFGETQYWVTNVRAVEK